MLPVPQVGTNMKEKSLRREGKMVGRRTFQIQRGSLHRTNLTLPKQDGNQAAGDRKPFKLWYSRKLEQKSTWFALFCLLG